MNEVKRGKGKGQGADPEVGEAELDQALDQGLGPEQGGRKEEESSQNRDQDLPLKAPGQDRKATALVLEVPQDLP